MRYIAIASLLMFALAGCGKSSTASATPGSQSVAAGPAAGSATASAPKSKCVLTPGYFEQYNACKNKEEEDQAFHALIDPTPLGDASVPDSNYREVKTEAEVAYLAAAVGQKAPDYTAIAQEISHAYVVEHDVFKKQALLEKLTPQFQQGIDAAKGGRYIVVILDAGPVGLQHYDPAKKGFPIQIKPDSAFHLGWMSGIGLDSKDGNAKPAEFVFQVVNASSLPVALVPPDEQMAQAVEAKLSGNEPPTVALRVYCFVRAVQVDPRTNGFLPVFWVQMMHAQVVDSHSKAVLFSAGPFSP